MPVGVCDVTSAPMPALATLMNGRSLIRPTSMARGVAEVISTSAFAGSVGTWQPVAKSLAVPRGMMPMAVAEGSPARNGLPRRLYIVTPAGMVALRASRDTLKRMWHGLDHLFKEPTS